MEKWNDGVPKYSEMKSVSLFEIILNKQKSRPGTLLLNQLCNFMPVFERKLLIILTS